MRFAVLLSLAVLAATPAWSQSAPGSAAASEPSARQLELSRRYVELVQSDAMEGAIRAMIASEANADPSLEGMPDDEREFMIDLAADVATDLLPQMMDRLVPVYASIFTEPELTALVDFYGSPLGESIARKTVASMAEQDAAMMAVVPQMIQKMAARLCARYGCDAAEMTAIMSGAMPEAAPPARVK